jgi:hypothetical protein
MIICLKVVYEYDNILIILIDDILIININYVVKLIFPLRNTRKKNRAFDHNSQEEQGLSVTQFVTVEAIVEVAIREVIVDEELLLLGV